MKKQETVMTLRSLPLFEEIITTSAYSQTARDAPSLRIKRNQSQSARESNKNTLIIF